LNTGNGLSGQENRKLPDTDIGEEDSPEIGRFSHCFNKIAGHFRFSLVNPTCAAVEIPGRRSVND